MCNVKNQTQIYKALCKRKKRKKKKEDLWLGSIMIILVLAT